MLDIARFCLRKMLGDKEGLHASMASRGWTSFYFAFPKKCSRSAFLFILDMQPPHRWDLDETFTQSFADTRESTAFFQEHHGCHHAPEKAFSAPTSEARTWICWFAWDTPKNVSSKNKGSSAVGPNQTSKIVIRRSQSQSNNTTGPLWGCQCTPRHSCWPWQRWGWSQNAKTIQAAFNRFSILRQIDFQIGMETRKYPCNTRLYPLYS